MNYSMYSLPEHLLLLVYFRNWPLTQMQQEQITESLAYTLNLYIFQSDIIFQFTFVKK